MTSTRKGNGALSLVLQFAFCYADAHVCEKMLPCCIKWIAWRPNVRTVVHLIEDLRAILDGQVREDYEHSSALVSLFGNNPNALRWDFRAGPLAHRLMAESIVYCSIVLQARWQQCIEELGQYVSKWQWSVDFLALESAPSSGSQDNHLPAGG